MLRGCGDPAQVGAVLVPLGARDQAGQIVIGKAGKAHMLHTRVHQGDPAGVELLERFLTLSPEHPAAAGVRDLIRNGPEEEP